MSRRFRVRVAQTDFDVEVQSQAEGIAVVVEGQTFEVFEAPERSWRVVPAGTTNHHIVTLEPGARPSSAAIEGRTVGIEVRSAQEAALAAALAAAGHGIEGAATVASPMPGRVVRVLVEPDQTVERDQPLVIVEAMKMENEVRAPVPGLVAKVGVAAGDTVDAGQMMVELSPHPDSA